MTFTFGILAGDDIGPDVVAEAVRVGRAALETVGVEAEWEDLAVGRAAYETAGTSLPDDTLARLDMLDGWILGPLGHSAYPQDDPKAFNPHPVIRKRFDMYGSHRPARSRPGIPCVRRDVDLVIVRENTEGFPPDRNMLVGKAEFRPTDDMTLSIRVITRHNSERIARAAFALAATRAKRRVTAVHKASVFKLGCGMFAEECRKVAAEHADVGYDEVMVDTCAQKMVMEADRFDVIVTTNTFGDILVDLAAGLVGGMGMAAAISFGREHVMAQASHGSAPDIAGRGIANPTAEILSLAMMFAYLGRRRGDGRLVEAAAAMERAVDAVIDAGGPLTPDIGGDATTEAMGGAVAVRIGA